MNRRTFLESILASAAALPLASDADARTLLPGPQGTPNPDGVAVTGARAAHPLLLSYTRAASKWVEALPVGNGRIGAMVFGNVGVEHLQLNDDTLWSGGPSDWNDPAAKDVLPEVRALIRAGRFVEADRLSKRLMGPFTQSYLPLGDLFITFDHGNLGGDYRRSLDLRQAVASVAYRTGTVHYTREVIASHPADVIAMRLAVDRPGMLHFDARLSSALRHSVAPADGVLAMRGEAPSHVDPSYYDADEPVLYGRVPAHGTPRRGPGSLGGTEPSPGGMRFEAHLGAVLTDGDLAVDTDGLHVRGASEATLLVSMATSFNGYDKSLAREGRDPARIAAETLASARKIRWPELRNTHADDHRALFERVVLDLGATTEAAGELSTDQRIAALGAKDPRLVELLFQYGRYL